MAKIFGHIFIFILSTIVLVAVIGAVTLKALPDVKVLETCFTTSMFKVKLCPSGGSYARIKEISPYMVHAVIAAEDGAFYSHKGLDWHEIQESFNKNLHSGKMARGGSTLTQQLAKNVFLSQEKSLWRKVKEAYLAYAIEQKYPKDFILEKYLNVVEFGPNIYGVKAAANHYFHKAPSQLHPLESAFLAFLLPNPKLYSKSFRTGQLTPFGRKMVKTILKRMQSFGKLSVPAYQTAVAQIGAFPWSGIGIDSFEGRPTYSLDAVAGSPAQIDEETLDEIMSEDEGGGAEVIDFEKEE